MQFKEAQRLLQAEMRSGSSVAKALTVLFAEAEIQAYRTTSRTTDPMALATATGRAQGIHQVLTLISPKQDATTEGRGPTSP